LQELKVENENIKLISEHIPTHLRPLTDNQFGQYLAGLIDGDGGFSRYSASIAFHSHDVSLAYYIKKRIGFGIVRKVKNKNAYVLTISKREGLQILLNLINGKLRIKNKCEAVYKNILNLYKEPLSFKDKFYLNTSNDLDNH
jgi:hypothetical protein